LLRARSARAEWAASQGLGVLILNPNHRKCAGHSERHCVAAWDAFVTPSSAQHIVMVAHSYGGVCTGALLATRREAVTSRLRAVALTDSVHGRSVERMPAAQRDFFVRRCINWVTSDKPLDALVRAAVHEPPPGTDAGEGGGAAKEEDAGGSKSESQSDSGAEVLSDDDDSAPDAVPAAAPVKRCVTRARVRAPPRAAAAACTSQERVPRARMLTHLAGALRAWRPLPRRRRGFWSPPWCDAARVSAGVTVHESTSEECRPSACAFLLRELRAAGWTPPGEATSAAEAAAVNAPPADGAAGEAQAGASAGASAGAMA
jgi:hypothetical protein